MRIAVVLFGEPRVPECGAKYFPEAFKDCEIDYYCHAWNTITEEPFNRRSKQDPDHIKKVIEDLYSPSVVIAHDYDDMMTLLSGVESDEGLKRIIKTGAKINQWWSFQMAADTLRSSTKDYDFVVISRYDIAFVPHPGIVQKVMNAIKHCNQDECGNKIIISDYNKNLNNPSMSDLVTFGTREGVLALADDFVANRVRHIRAKHEWAMSDKFPIFEQMYQKWYIDPKQFREMWGMQLIDNKIERRVLRQEEMGKIHIARVGVPDLDLDTIIHYEKYYSYFRRKAHLAPEMRNRRNIFEYDPKFHYRKA